MRWADLDDDGIWRIPSEDREKGNATELALPEAALNIIKRQPSFTSNPYVFVGRGQGHFKSWSHAKLAIDKKLGIATPWRLHDLRRTARSLMSRAGVRPDIAERVLGHAIVGVEGIYDRHRYTVEKADALTKLAGLISLIIAEPVGNVTTLRKIA